MPSAPDMTHITPELLAPAGSPEALAAAIEGGADAVYFGAKNFSARMRAKNFETAEIADAIALCRAHGVRSYITVNTRLRDAELPAVLETVDAVYRAGADALIIADLGAVSLVRERYPALPLHASTQLSGACAGDAAVLASLGFSRMVCPRELSLSQLSSLCQTSPIEIEMFIHGAHCVSFSGQCMLSYAMGGRSGNRGECAQPCRLPFRVSDAAGSGSDYPLSLRDMCLAAHVREIMLSGAVSLKIEGRQKSPDYVYGVTRMYRTLLDEKRDATPEEIRSLADLFSRDGFSDGYFRHNYRAMLGVRRPDDAERSRTAPAFPGLTKKTPVTAVFRAAPGIAATLSLSDGNRTVTVAGMTPDAAKNAALTAESARRNLEKLGSTPYILTDFHAEIEGELFLTAAALNALRRDAVAALLAAPTRPEPRTIPITEKRPRRMAEKIRRTAEFLSLGQIPEGAEEFFDEIYLPLRLRAREYSVALPPYATGQTVSQIEASLSLSKPRSLLVHSPAEISLARRLGIPALASLRLNVFNSRTADCIHSLGAETVTVSPEVPLGAVRDVRVPRAVVAYGRLPLMLTLRCAISDGGTACHAGGTGGFLDGKEKGHLCLSSLRDRTGCEFPLVGMYDCTNVLYNSVPIYMADRADVLAASGADTWHFIFSTESKKEAAEVIRAYREGTPPTDASAVRRMK